MLHDDTGSGENVQRPILHSSRPMDSEGGPRRSSVYWMDDKIGESLDNVFRLRVDKGERTAAYTGRCRELFEKAA